MLPLEPDCPGWTGVVKVPPKVLARPGFLYQISITRSAGGHFGDLLPQYTSHEATGLPSTGAAGLTETGGGGHLIGARLGETVLVRAGQAAAATPKDDITLSDRSGLENARRPAVRYARSADHSAGSAHP
jgi:hypothetical protein